jgi:hypothetical protein
MRRAFLRRIHRFTADGDEHVVKTPEATNDLRAAPPTGLKLWFESNEAVAEFVDLTIAPSVVQAVIAS